MRGCPSRSAVRHLARVELRRRVFALVVLGLLVGLTGGVALASAAGARRADSAYERFLTATLAADAAVFASQEGLYDPDYEPIRELPYVAAAGAFSIPFFPERACLFVPNDDWLATVDRPVLSEGRLPDRDNPDEVVLSPPNSPETDAGLGVGDTVTVTLFSPEQAEVGDTSVDPEGPRATLTVVGIGRSSFEISTIPDTDGCLFGTPAFLDHYDHRGAVFHNLMVRFEDGQGDIHRLATDVERVLGRPVPIQDLSENVKRVTNGTDLERSGLVLFSVAVAATGTLILGQALTRSVRSMAGDVATIRALGLTRHQAATVLMLPHLVVVAVGAAASILVAVALSPRLPIGLARSVDPDLGWHLDLVVLGPGVAALVAVLLAAIVGTASAVVRPRASASATTGSSIVAGIARAGAPVATTVGAGLALEPGRGDRALPTRPAVLGAIVGVLGVVGGLTLGAGIEDAVEHRERFGTTWDLELFDYSGEDAALSAVVEALDDDPDVAGQATVQRVNLPSGAGSLPTFTVDAPSGSPDFVVLDGRRPERQGEVVLGPATAKSLGLTIGDSFALGTQKAPLEVVGLGLVHQSPHSQFDQGAWVSVEQGAELFRSADLGPFGVVTGTFVDLRPGVDSAAKAAELQARVGEVEVSTPAVIADQEHMRGVRGLPALFAAFTLVLALGALVHVSTSVLRRRHGELAVLRAVGMTPHQSWWCLSWQATVLATIGLVVGIPLGIAAGRLGWHSVAEATPLVYVAPLDLPAVLLAVPVTLVLANVVASVPGRRAAQLTPADALRTE